MNTVPSIAPDQQQSEVLLRGMIERLTPLVEVLHRPPIDFEDHVARPQTGDRAGAVRIDCRDDYTASLGEVEFVRQIRVHLPDGESERDGSLPLPPSREASSASCEGVITIGILRAARSRITVSIALRPTGTPPTISGNCCASRTSCWSIRTMMSPCRKPAAFAGLLSITSLTSAPARHV